jgi:hypothetical protein
MQQLKHPLSKVIKYIFLSHMNYIVINKYIDIYIYI